MIVSLPFSYTLQNNNYCKGFSKPSIVEKCGTIDVLLCGDFLAIDEPSRRAGSFNGGATAGARTAKVAHRVERGQGVDVVEEVPEGRTEA